MKKICIFCCSKVTHKLGCSSAQCLYDLKNRTGEFERYIHDNEVELVGLVNCPGCPTQIAPDRIINQIDYLTEFQVEAIHFTNCINTYCAYRYEYKSLIEMHYPDVEVIMGTGKPHITNLQREIIERDIREN